MWGSLYLIQRRRRRLESKATNRASLIVALRQAENKLTEYIDTCRKLEGEIADLRNDLDNEMGVSEKLLDLNIELKGKIREMQRLAKVRVHPSSMEALQKALNEKCVAVNQLREALKLAIRLIPEDRYRRMHIPGLQKIYNEIF